MAPRERKYRVALCPQAGEPQLTLGMLIERSASPFGLLRDLTGLEQRNERERTWLLTRIRQAAPQTLTVPS